MGEPADSRPTGSLRELVEEVLLAGLGAVALTRDKADALVDELVQRGRLTRDEASEVADGLASVSRSGGQRLTARTAHALGGLFRDLGLVTEAQYAELELKVAQLEHRLRLLEKRLAERADLQ